MKARLFTLGVVVFHFGLAVRNPKKSAQWFQRALGLRKEFEFEDGVAVGNENVTIVLFKGKAVAGNAWAYVISPAGHGRTAKGA